MKRKSTHCFSLSLALLLVLQKYKAVAFSSDQLLTTYSLHSGRSSACPESISYTLLTSDRPLMPAASMKAGKHLCRGKGGKWVVEGSSLVSHGLNLPALVTDSRLSFYAGVETDVRICGPWAFNASSISWFVLNNSGEDVLDDDTSISFQSGYIYVTYSHFSDICVYRTEVEALPDATPGPSNMPETEAGVEQTTEDEPDNDESACFPGNALVTVQDRGLVEMRNVEIGDRVLSSANGTFSEVFAFSHRDPFALSTFIYIQTSSGKRLPLSPGHLLFLHGVPRTAKEARIGHDVMTASGTSEGIIRVERSYMKGLYNPQTLSGNIIVNGILATTWTSAVPPISATSLLSPMRWLYRMTPTKVSSLASTYLELVIDQFRFVSRCTLVLRR